MEKKTTKTVAKKVVTKKVEVKKSLDEIAFEKLISNEKYKNVLRSCGRGKLSEIYFAGLKRGKSSK